MNHNMRNIIISAISMALTLTSCSGTRGLVTPRLDDMPASFTPGSGPATDSMSIADMAWWEIYSDSTLRHLMRTALDDNRDLLKAASRVEQPACNTE